jgi:NADP-dependent 3-hydroxy acid dehydrogenase YdfG
MTNPLNIFITGAASGFGRQTALRPIDQFQDILDERLPGTGKTGE